MNESLKAYQLKFEKQLKNLHQELDDTFTKESDYQSSEIKRGYDRIQALDDMCATERSDRIQDLNDQLSPIEAQIEMNTNDLNEERNQRVTNERMILDNLATDAKKIEDTILQEQQERQEMQGDLVNSLGSELNRQREKIERIKSDTLDEFTKDKRDIDKEMNNRFDQQDRVIRDISKFISTFQKTLRAVGEKEE